MWELSQSHCCATCRYSFEPDFFMEPSAPEFPASRTSVAELFPLEETLACEFCLESLGEDCVRAVLVRPEGRCAAYECDSERYEGIHGIGVLEDEELYSLHVLEAAQALKQHSIIYL